MISSFWYCGGLWFLSSDFIQLQASSIAYWQFSNNSSIAENMIQWIIIDKIPAEAIEMKTKHLNRIHNENSPDLLFF